MDPETIDPLLSALPPSWLAAIEAYAPHVIAWLLAITVIVHLLVPVARAVERWAVASSVTWDDGPARRFAEIVEWAAGATTAVLAWLPRLAAGGMRGGVSKTETTDRHIDAPLPWPEAPPPPPPPRNISGKPPSDTGAGLALLIVAAACSAALYGCSSGPQLPIVTVPMSISCSWHVPIGQVPERDASIVSPSSADGSGGVIVTDNDCTIDRSAASADPRTTGNDNRGVRVDPTTSVSGLGQ